MLLLLVFFSLIPLITCTDYNVTQLDPNTSVYTEEIGTLQYYESYWKIITNVNLGQYQQNAKEIKAKISQMNKLCKVIKTLTQVDHCNKFNSEIKAIEKSLSAQEYIIENFLQTAQQSRNKRSIIDGVGKVFNILFGTLDVDDAQYYDEQISEMSIKQINTINLIQNQTSLVRSSINIIQDKFLNNDKNIQALTYNLNKIEDDVSRICNYTNLNHVELKIFEELQEILTAIILESRLLQDEQNRLLDILLYSSQGKLHPYLINPNQLESVLKDIEKKLPQHLTVPSSNGIIEKHIIYEISTFDASILDNSIIFKINIPLTLEHKYDLTHLISLPIIIRDQNIHIRLEYEYIAISDNFLTYTLLNKEDIDTCFNKNNIYYCKLNKILFNIHVHKTCELELKLKNTLDLCKTVEIKSIDEIYIHLKQPNSYLYSLNKDVSVHIKCTHNSYNDVLNHIGILTLNKNCIMQTPSLTMYGQTELLHTKMNYSTLKFENISESHIKNNLTVIKSKFVPILDDTRKLDEIDSNLKKLNQIEINLKNQRFHNVHHYTSTYSLIILAIIGITIILFKKKCKKQKIQKNIELQDIITENPISTLQSPETQINTFQIPISEDPIVPQTSDNPRFFLKGGGVV